MLRLGFDSTLQGYSPIDLSSLPDRACWSIARVGRSIECDLLPVLIFGVISIVKLDGLGLGGGLSIIPSACGNILRGMKSDILGKATA